MLTMSNEASSKTLRSGRALTWKDTFGTSSLKRVALSTMVCGDVDADGPVEARGQGARQPAHARAEVQRGRPLARSSSCAAWSMTSAICSSPVPVEGVAVPLAVLALGLGQDGPERILGGEVLPVALLLRELGHRGGGENNSWARRRGGRAPPAQPVQQACARQRAHRDHRDPVRRPGGRWRRRRALLAGGSGRAMYRTGITASGGIASHSSRRAVMPIQARTATATAQHEARPDGEEPGPQRAEPGRQRQGGGRAEAKQRSRAGGSVESSATSPRRPRRRRRQGRRTRGARQDHEPRQRRHQVGDRGQPLRAEAEARRGASSARSASPFANPSIGWGSPEVALAAAAVRHVARQPRARSSRPGRARRRAGRSGATSCVIRLRPSPCERTVPGRGRGRRAAGAGRTRLTR